MFYLLGFSSHQPNGNWRKQQFFNCTKYIQALVCATLGCTAIISINSVNQSAHQRLAETIIIHVYLICEVARSSLILLEIFIYKNTLAEIINTFEDLELYFVKRLKHHISFRRFIKQYRVNVIVCMGFAMFYCVTYFIRCMAGQYCTYASYITKLFQLVTAMSYLHMIFFVEALSYYLYQLNLTMKRVTMLPMNSEQDKQLSGNRIRHKLKYCKIIHFRLWTVSRRISQYFGYSSIALSMHSFTDLIYSLFWIYLMVKDKSPIYNIWSESINSFPIIMQYILRSVKLCFCLHIFFRATIFSILQLGFFWNIS